MFESNVPYADFDGIRLQRELISMRPRWVVLESGQLREVMKRTSNDRLLGDRPPQHYAHVKHDH